MVRVANAPLSYGSFEMTVGIFPNVPGPEELLREMAAAGYEGTELGPPGYLGEGEELRARLERHGLALTGGWCPLRFSEPEHWEEDFAELRRTLELFEAAGGAEAPPVFGDGGSEGRRGRWGALSSSPAAASSSTRGTSSAAVPTRSRLFATGRSASPTCTRRT